MDSIWNPYGFHMEWLHWVVYIQTFTAFTLRHKGNNLDILIISGLSKSWKLWYSCKIWRWTRLHSSGWWIKARGEGKSLGVSLSHLYTLRPPATSFFDFGVIMFVENNREESSMQVFWYTRLKRRKQWTHILRVLFSTNIITLISRDNLILLFIKAK